jgi:5-deoxy-glucuronate isomerase
VTSSYHPRLSGTPYQKLIHDANSSLRFLELECVALHAGGEWTRPADGREVVIVPLAGAGTVSVAGVATLTGRIAREDVFTASPSTAYVPPAHTVSVTADDGLEAVVVSAPWPASAARPMLLPADAVAVTTVGSGDWQRTVRMLFGPDGVTARLLVGETINPPGKWSGMPPHRHDRAGPEESQLEEVYYFRLSPPDGYLVQLYYDRNGWHAEDLITGEGAVTITRGYHPTVAFPGTTGFYLWALAGPEKTYKISIDPAFEWMRAEARS